MISEIVVHFSQNFDGMKEIFEKIAEAARENNNGKTALYIDNVDGVGVVAYVSDRHETNDAIAAATHANATSHDARPAPAEIDANDLPVSLKRDNEVHPETPIGFGQENLDDELRHTVTF